MRDENAVLKLIRRYKPETIYHLAGIAITHGVQFSDYISVNVNGTYNLAKAVLEECGSNCRFMFISSAGVYGSANGVGQCFNEAQTIQPRNIYGASKASAEMALWTLYSKGLDLIIVRPFNHTGPGQRLGFVVPDLISRLKRSINELNSNTSFPSLTVGRLDSIRDFTDVRDVVRAYVLVMGKSSAGEIINISSGIPLSIHELVEMLCSSVAKVSGVKLISTFQNSADVGMDVLVGDPKKLKSLGWAPRIKLEQTLLDMWRGVGADYEAYCD